MARVKAETPVVQSLLDRLTNHEDWPSTRNSSLAMYRDGIKRDVEWLLNSRRSFIPAIDNYKLASSSVFNFGLPDLTQFASSYGPEGLRMCITQTMRDFEPRIRDPHITLVRTDESSRSVRFHVDGRLVFENSEEDISFDTVLEVTSGEYAVR